MFVPPMSNRVKLKQFDTLIDDPTELFSATGVKQDTLF